MNQFSFSIPQNIIVGSGSFSKLSQAAVDLDGKHAFIISGPSLYQNGIVDRAISYLRTVGIQADFFKDIEANPSVTTVEKATEAFQSSQADFIVALGGGSPMDVAKAVAVVAKYGGSITQYEGAHKVPGKTVPLIAIPTTAGTGSEVTAFLVITDHERNYKMTVFSYELLPQYAILDPELIGSSLRRFVANRQDIGAAENMLTGSLFAGIAFSFARLGNVHAMSHPVSAYFDVAHGVANAVLLPVVTEYNALADHGKYLHIYNTISHRKVNEDHFEPLMLVDSVKALLEDIGIPKGLLAAVHATKGKEAITEAELKRLVPAMAGDAMESGNIAVNPRSSTITDVENSDYTAF